jgi:hypothetical protein
VALAGLERLGRDGEATDVFAPDVMLPSPGQGALAVECADAELAGVLAVLDAPLTRAAVVAERTMLAVLEAGCSAPVGGHAIASDDNVLSLTGVVATVSGSRGLRLSRTGQVSEPEGLGRLVAEALLADGDGGKPRANLQEIWPHLECFVHGGVPVAPFHDQLRRMLGPNVNFHEVYPASEAFIAAQDADASAGLRLIADAGVFFEFVPMAAFEEAKVSELGSRAVPASGVRTGVDYALVLTTPAGLARYVVGDVVRFLSTEPLRIVHVGRTQLQLSAFGEHVVEKEITDALLAVCRRNGWTIVNFHVAPIFTSSTTGRSRGRHEWWVELKPGTPLTPTGPIIALELDAELKRLNQDYETKRSNGGLEAPFVRLVMPGVFEQWMRFHGKWGGQNKMPRCQDDRVIADELGSALQFAND